MQEGTARDFLFAVEYALNAITQSDMQSSVKLFSKACKKFGFILSTNPAPTCTSGTLVVADKVIYLGSTLPRSVNIDEDVAYRISRISMAFGRLKNKSGSDEN